MIDHFKALTHALHVATAASLQCKSIAFVLQVTHTVSSSGGSGEIPVYACGPAERWLLVREAFFNAAVCNFCTGRGVGRNMSFVDPHSFNPYFRQAKEETLPPWQLWPHVFPSTHHGKTFFKLRIAALALPNQVSRYRCCRQQVAGLMIE
jgi:hypothetical protein